MIPIITKTSAGLKLGLLAAMITLLAGPAIAQLGLIVNETFDPPTISLDGWQGNADNISRDYVSEGVKDSTAVRISATLVDPGPVEPPQTRGAYVGTMLYQHGLLLGTGRATPQNTSLSFDLKVDQPGMLSVVVGLQGWGGWAGNWLTPDLPATASRGTVPLGHYVPGEFKTVVVPLDDPLWTQDPYVGYPVAGPFDPSGKTYQIWLQVDSGGLPDYGAFTVTIDNIKLTTKNPMVPWRATTSGKVTQYTIDAGGNITSATLQETGYANKLGKFVETIVFTTEGFAKGIGTVELTAANGDKLFGTIFLVGDEFAVSLENGTGRFEDAVAGYFGKVTWTSPMTFTAEAEGSISTVGSNNK